MPRNDDWKAQSYMSDWLKEMANKKEGVFAEDAETREWVFPDFKSMATEDRPMTDRRLSPQERAEIRDLVMADGDLADFVCGEFGHSDGKRLVCEDVPRLLADLDAADAENASLRRELETVRKHGAWIQKYELVRGWEDNSEDPYTECPFCGRKSLGSDVDYPDSIPKYCEDCGAVLSPPITDTITTATEMGAPFDEPIRGM